MKKAYKAVIYLLFAFLALIPAASLIAGLFGYVFELKCYPVFVVVLAVLSVASVIIKVFFLPACNDAVDILFSLMPPLLLVDFIWVILSYSSFWVSALFLLSLLCCGYLMIEHGKPKVLKWISVALSVLMLLPAAFFGVFFPMFSGLSVNTVVRKIVSPDEKYYVEIIDNGQGALGGATFVDLYENKGIDTVVFKIYKEPERIFEGDWGAFEHIQVEWKNDSCQVRIEIPEAQ